jgi:hypothetical protein
MYFTCIRRRTRLWLKDGRVVRWRGSAVSRGGWDQAVRQVASGNIGSTEVGDNEGEVTRMGNDDEG